MKPQSFTFTPSEFRPKAGVGEHGNGLEASYTHRLVSAVGIDDEADPRSSGRDVYCSQVGLLQESATTKSRSPGFEATAGRRELGGKCASSLSVLWGVHHFLG